MVGTSTGARILTQRIRTLGELTWVCEVWTRSHTSALASHCPSGHPPFNRRRGPYASCAPCKPRTRGSPARRVDAPGRRWKAPGMTCAVRLNSALFLLIPSIGCSRAVASDDAPRAQNHRQTAQTAHASSQGAASASPALSNGPRPSTHTARNVILVIGDGMPQVSEVATSRYLYGTDYGLRFQSLPHKAFVTTWDINVYNARARAAGSREYSPSTFDPRIGYDPIKGGASPYPMTPETEISRAYFSQGAWAVHPDSASTATAMATGVKTQSAAIGWLTAEGGGRALESSPEYLRKHYQMAIGFVTTVPFSHATPAGFFAHNPDRNNYNAIAGEILNRARPEVVIGAGWNDPTYYSPADLKRALATGDWEFVHEAAQANSNDTVLAGAARAQQTGKHLLGIFGGGQNHYVSPMPQHSPGSPRVDTAKLDRPLLENSCIAALQVLAQNPQGFFLLIEQGHIDWANHSQDFDRMIGGVWELDRAVQAVMDFVARPGDNLDWTNTTLFVTADHANGHMRFGRTLGKGELPKAIDAAEPGQRAVTFDSAGHHTSELVDLYATGVGAAAIAAREVLYPGTSIIDDTALYHLTLGAAAR